MSQRLLRGRGRRTRRKVIASTEVRRLRGRVSRLERGRDFINLYTDTDDSDPIIGTPVIIKIN